MINLTSDERRSLLAECKTLTQQIEALKAEIERLQNEHAEKRHRIRLSMMESALAEEDSSCP